jgi:hypothetical protein
MDEHRARLTELPAEVRRYFDAVGRGRAAEVAECFVEGGVVVDVDQAIVGRAAIRAWAEEEVVGGTYRVLSSTRRDGGVAVLLTFAPPDDESDGFRARYTFELEDGKISRVELQYA